MRVSVRLFARARDLAGSDAVAVELPDAATVGDLRARLAAELLALAGLLPRCAVAVDQDFADDAAGLHDGAEVAVLPPVSGGSDGRRVSGVAAQRRRGQAPVVVPVRRLRAQPGRLPGHDKGPAGRPARCQSRGAGVRTRP